MMKKLLNVALILTLAAAAGNTHAAAQKGSEAINPGSEAGSQQMMNAVSGKVVETMSSGGYTYIQIEKDAKKTWVAVPKADIKTGQDVSFYPGATMPNFESKTLNRTFDSVIFSPGLVDAPDVEAASNPHGNKQSAPVNNEPIKIDKASGPDAYTIEEIYNKKSSLDKKNVVVKGKVVKVSENIMNKNWIHIQDGSGTAGDGTNDIIATSADMASVGDIVTVSGTLVSDMDIGSGYKFDVIIEQAKITK
jgi:hypothetical protein